MIEEVLREPDEADRRALLEVLASAFCDNPMNVRIHGPSARRRVRANRAGLRALVLDERESTLARVIVARERVVGGFVAQPPGAPPLHGPSIRRQIGCFWHQGGRAMDQWGQVSRDLGVLRPERDHWYVAALGVRPDCWGQGFGGRLLEGLFELARRQPAPIYLESDREASVRFYEGRGFECGDPVSVHNVRCWCLGRGFG